MGHLKDLNLDTDFKKPKRYREWTVNNSVFCHSIRYLKQWESTPYTLSFYNNEPSKNKHFLILLSSPARNSQEPKLKRIFEIPWVLFEKSLSLYFDWPKSWIWLTLEKVMNVFCRWHFTMPQKKSFSKKKFGFHARVQKCHFGKIEKFKFFFGQKQVFEALWKWR